MFAVLYDKVLIWSRHRHAPWYLSFLSFAESSFFPVPPDVMLAPMSLAKPTRAYYFALLTTFASVLGGILGYLIGAFAFDLATPMISDLGYDDAYNTAKTWFDQWGIWVVFLAGFSPVPYKVFTITAGAVAMAFLPFVIVSLIGRGARFFLVAALIRMGGARMEEFLRKYIDRIGWILVMLIVVAYLLYR
ncbi:MAG: YqaA family protein [Gammaproteobacteria bacterium]